MPQVQYPFEACLGAPEKGFFGGFLPAGRPGSPDQSQDAKIIFVPARELHAAASTFIPVRWAASADLVIISSLAFT
jgi:hypothetical protein